jgi:hypothetical protein
MIHATVARPVPETAGPPIITTSSRGRITYHLNYIVLQCNSQGFTGIGSCYRGAS